MTIREKFSSDFRDTLQDYGLLLWKESFQSRSWSYSEWPHDSHFGFLRLRHRADKILYL